MILNNKKEENRTITINNKNYYENELNETMRNSLIALSTQKLIKQDYKLMLIMLKF